MLAYKQMTVTDSCNHRIYVFKGEVIIVDKYAHENSVLIAVYNYSIHNTTMF